MGRQPPLQGKLFYMGLQIGNRVRRNHPLRRIAEVIDFDFIYEEVDDRYGTNGNVSVPPPVLLKMMLLLVLYNVRSERELMETLPERLDWLWFLGYDLDAAIPDHSVLSKARRRWGAEVFRRVFERVVRACVEAGLVDGSKIFVDSSLVDADASRDSVVNVADLKAQLTEKYRLLEARLEEAPSERVVGPYADTNGECMSATDPDAALVNRGGTELRYQVHRAVEGQSEVITATEVTPGDVNEAHLLMDLAREHEQTTGEAAGTVVADSKYGTAENYLTCHDAGVQAHIPEFRQGTEKRLQARGLFMEDRFRYVADRDVYVCPAGQELKRKTLHWKRRRIDYGAPKRVCAACPLRDQCTRNKAGRTVSRHIRQETLTEMRQAAASPGSLADLRQRQHLCERSFATSVRYGYKRARWRRLWRVAIQNYLTCTLQNIEKLVKYGLRPAQAGMMVAGHPEAAQPMLPARPETLWSRVRLALAWIGTSLRDTRWTREVWTDG
jgi:transposase